MHKATFLEGTLHLTIRPNGPVLIKAGESGGADPTRPDMEFVRTQRNGVRQVYLPGPSLKGVVRAQAERICRTLDQEGRNPDQDNPPLADNPLGTGTSYNGLTDMEYSSGRYTESIRERIKEDPQRTAIIYRRSSFVSQMFGHTSLAGRVRFADAYASSLADIEMTRQEDPAASKNPAERVQPEPVALDERNGVAIDRIYGSVAVGPFNYETLVAGDFTTRIDFKNITLAHLALLGLALRDLAEQRIAVGFGKSRGLGRVNVTFDSLELRYPLCELQNGTLCQINKREIAPTTHLVGVGAFCTEESYQAYSLPTDDTVLLPAGLEYTDNKDMLRVVLCAKGDKQVRAIWRACMTAWKRGIGL
jgi:CRISPR/Cas system CSM-associated protein Csm3 (group 7 of RAMP superfamily)